MLLPLLLLLQKRAAKLRGVQPCRAARQRLPPRAAPMTLPESCAHNSLIWLELGVLVTSLLEKPGYSDKRRLRFAGRDSEQVQL
jgi:hypothetical protein